MEWRAKFPWAQKETRSSFINLAFIKENTNYSETSKNLSEIKMFTVRRSIYTGVIIHIQSFRASGIKSVTKHGTIWGLLGILDHLKTHVLCRVYTASSPSQPSKTFPVIIMPVRGVWHLAWTICKWELWNNIVWKIWDEFAENGHKLTVESFFTESRKSVTSI